MLLVTPHELREQCNAMVMSKMGKAIKMHAF